MTGELRTADDPAARWAWVTVAAAVVFFAAGGTLVGGYLALPAESAWALSVGSEMAAIVPVDRAEPVEALYRQVLGGALAGAVLGALAGATLARWLAHALSRSASAEATG